MANILVKLANKLDSEGRYKEADQITSLLEKFATSNVANQLKQFAQIVEEYEANHHDPKGVLDKIREIFNINENSGLVSDITYVFNNYINKDYVKEIDQERPIAPSQMNNKTLQDLPYDEGAVAGMSGQAQSDLSKDMIKQALSDLVVVADELDKQGFLYASNNLDEVLRQLAVRTNLRS